MLREKSPNIKTKKMKINKEKALYIHIPFCNNICDYCDFTKLQYFPLIAKKYLQCLKLEIKSYDIEKLETIYIGGGTPTSLDDDLFEELLKMIYPYTDGVKEYTVEANPESLSKTKLLMMKKYGVNRISLGVESTDNEVLHRINRKHTFLDVINVTKLMNEVGFDNYSFDLILGLPSTSIETIRKDINKLLSLNPKHISCYSLTIHEHTKFYIDGIKEYDDDFIRTEYDLVNDILTKNGYIHYEISNWATDGYYSLHNLVYWRDEGYFGVGLGASGYVSGYRYTNTRSINKYLKGLTLSEKEVISLKADKEYFIMLNLRTIFGLNRHQYIARFNEDLFITKECEINSLIKGGLLLKKDDEIIFPTYEGMMLLDRIILELI